MKGNNMALAAIAVAVLVIIGLYAGLNMKAFVGGVWDECVTTSQTTCEISQSVHSTFDAVYVSVPSHPEWGVPLASAGDTCIISYNDVYIYSPSVGQCPQAHSNCNPITITWTGTVGGDMVCRVLRSPDIGTGGYTYQRYFNQPVSVAVQQQCQNPPAKPCGEAVFTGYPGCSWDTSACNIVPPPPGDWLSGFADWLNGIIAGIKAWFCTYLGTGCS